MGWTHLLDENDKVIGMVGDEGWDAAGVYVERLARNDKSLSLEMAIAYALSPNVEFLREPIRDAVLEFRADMELAYRRSPSIPEVESTIEFVFKVSKEVALGIF